MKNLFITFEGLDGSGKDSQLTNLYMYMKSENFFSDKYSNFWITREPTLITTSGKKLVKMLRGKTIDNSKAFEYFVQDRIEHSKMIRRIVKHSIVLSSRYDISTFTYQLSEGKNIEEIYDKHRFGQKDGSIIPDLTIIFEITVGTALERINKRNKTKVEAYENEKFLSQARKNQDTVIKWWQKNYPERKFLVVNGNNDIETVKEEMLYGIKRILTIEE